MASETAEYDLEIEPGRVVRFRELTAEEFESIVTGINNDEPGAGWKITQAGLRRSLIRDGAEELDFQKLVGAQLARRFRTKQLMMLRAAWDSVHLPNAEDQARVRAMKVVVG